MSDKLRECPLCKSRGQRTGIMKGLVRCSNGGCSLHDTMIHREEWQTRPTEDRLRERVGELEKALRRISGRSQRLDIRHENEADMIKQIHQIAQEALAGKE